VILDVTTCGTSWRYQIGIEPSIILQVGLAAAQQGFRLPVNGRKVACLKVAGNPSRSESRVPLSASRPSSGSSEPRPPCERSQSRWSQSRRESVTFRVPCPVQERLIRASSFPGEKLDKGSASSAFPFGVFCGLNEAMDNPSDVALYGSGSSEPRPPGQKASKACPSRLASRFPRPALPVPLVPRLLSFANKGYFLY
jgi:hypothetical protein